MKLDSKLLPILAAAVVLLAAGAFLVGQQLMSPDAGSGTSADARRPESATAGEPNPSIDAAVIAIRAGQFDEARKLLEQVDENDASYTVALSHLALVFETQGELEQALVTYDRLLSFEPDNIEALFGRGRTLFLADRYAEAEFATLRTLELAPQHVPARYQIALIRIAEGRLESGINAYLRAMDQSRDESRVLDALQDLSNLQQRKPDLAEAHYALAFFANTLGSTEQEVAELELYLEMQPEGPVADQARSRLAAARQTAGG